MTLLYNNEMDTLDIYGFGIKGFMLSMIECALEISNYSISQHEIDAILMIGKEMLNKSIELLDGVEEVLENLQDKHYCPIHQIL